MTSPEHSSRGFVKRDSEDNIDVKSDKVGDEDLESHDKRKHRSSKSRKSSEDTDELETSGRRRSSTDRNDSRKRSSGSSKAGSDDDYESRKELRLRQMKKIQEESTLEKLSSWYQDGDLDNKQDGRSKSGGRSHSQAEENEKRKMSSTISVHEHPQSRSKNKGEKLCDGEAEKMLDGDIGNSEKRKMCSMISVREHSQSRSKNKEEKHRDGEAERMLGGDTGNSEKRKNSLEKYHGSSDFPKDPKKWDEPDSKNVNESSQVESADLRKSSDPKHEGETEISISATMEATESKSRVLESQSDKDIKFNNSEERWIDAERSKSKGMSESLEDGSTVNSLDREDRSIKEKIENSRHHRNIFSLDGAESQERYFIADENETTLLREKRGSKLEHSNPERSGKRRQESENSEMDIERSSAIKWKEYEKVGCKGDRLKGRDENWSDKNWEIEVSKESWKRRPQGGSNDKQTKDRDIMYDHGRDWDRQRHVHGRTESERPQGRSGGRKDGRSEALKISTNYGISNENYDVIEIQTKGEDFGSSFSQRTEVSQQSDKISAPGDDEWPHKRSDNYGSAQSRNNTEERFAEEGTYMWEQWRDDNDIQRGKVRGQKGAISNRAMVSQNSSGGGSQPLFGNQDQGSFNRAAPQGAKGSRIGRGGRGRPAGRESQQVGMPVSMMASPFGPLGLPPPGPMQPLTPTMSPVPGPPVPMIGSPFGPLGWAGARSIDMNVLAVPPNLSPVPAVPRFSPNTGTLPNAAMYFNQPAPGRGMPPTISSPALTALLPPGRGQSHDKTSGGWVPPRSSGPPGKAPSRGEQNDYSQNFVDTGMRPQNFIRELELTNVVEDYPKLRELIQKKDEIVANSNAPPMYYKCDLREHVLSPEFFGTKFDVILVDPPWEEYVHRAPGAADHTDYWTFEQIQNLKIEAIADTPSFIFLWVGDGVGLEQGRQCLKKWGFRRCEDICWVKTNKSNAGPGLRHDSHTLFQHSKEHCLMGIKGTVRRSTDGHIIHANIDTDVIIAEEPENGSTEKPDDMYRIIEHFSLGRRRLELFGEDHNIRSGWLTVGMGLSSSNFNAEAYVRSFADKDGKVWQGGGGRNPPPESPHLVLTTPDIESLRPKSPMKNQLQMQHSASNSLTSNASTNKRLPAGNSPQNPTLNLTQEASGSNPSTPAPWASSPFEGVKGRENGNFGSDDRVYDMYGFNPTVVLPHGEPMDFDSHRAMNMF